MIRQPCRICGKIIEIEEPNGFDEVVHAVLVKMLTCSRCFSIYDRCRSLEEAIVSKAEIIAQCRDMENDRKSRLRDVIHRLLTEWAKNETLRFHGTVVPDVIDLVDMVVSAPTKVRIIIRDARKVIRSHCKSIPVDLPL